MYHSLYVSKSFGNLFCCKTAISWESVFRESIVIEALFHILSRPKRGSSKCPTKVVEIQSWYMPRIRWTQRLATSINFCTFVLICTIKIMHTFEFKILVLKFWSKHYQQQSLGIYTESSQRVGVSGSQHLPGCWRMGIGACATQGSETASLLSFPNVPPTLSRIEAMWPV